MSFKSVHSSLPFAKVEKKKKNIPERQWEVCSSTDRTRVLYVPAHAGAAPHLCAVAVDRGIAAPPGCARQEPAGTGPDIPHCLGLARLPTKEIAGKGGTWVSIGARGA